MTDYELDVTAEQIVRWFKSEQAAGRRPLEIRAAREYLAEPISDKEAFGLSDEADVASLVTIGTLEISPLGERDGWILRICVEDVDGPHTPEEESVPDTPELIDLEDFEAEFLGPDRGTTYVSVTAETLEAKQDFDRLLTDLMRDRHET